MRKKGSGKLKERINNWKIKVSNHNIAVNRLGHTDSYGEDRTSIQTPAVSCGAEAVSYTHLDVYKRQHYDLF